jgi:hypothetical protein
VRRSEGGGRTVAERRVESGGMKGEGRQSDRREWRVGGEGRKAAE